MTVLRSLVAWCESTLACAIGPRLGCVAGDAMAALLHFFTAWTLELTTSPLESHALQAREHRDECKGNALKLPGLGGAPRAFIRRLMVHTRSTARDWRETRGDWSGSLTAIGARKGGDWPFPGISI